MSRATILAVVLLLAPTAPVSAQALAVVGDVDWRSFRGHCRELLAALDKLSAPLPAETVKAAKALLDSEPETPRLAVIALQKLLDPYCLVGVHINPESRVKAARGARRADLARDRPALMLVKVHNEGGVRQGLSVASDQTILPGKKDPGRWLEAAVLASPFPKGLSGQLVEYRILRLTARQRGKREATLAFDVGQGTQDLGFRAETPILFTIR
jgi:hypothetical protein